jgi:molecular chaperone GrpE (heat shock protein)
MTESFAPRLPKWPFFFGDLCLLVLAWFIASRYGTAFGLGLMGICLAAVALGAWISIVPYLRDHQALLKMAEANTLSTSVAQLQNIEQIKNQIANSTSQWQFVQDESKKTVTAAREIADRMKAETREFCTFLEKANETEKAHLRLEVEKLRRSEGEWLQVLVRILDHIYALNQAGSRSGQPGLISQLNQFQHACRDAARRVGLISFAPARNDKFEPKTQQLADDSVQPRSGTLIIEALATGYSFQGHLIRKALVTLKPDNQPELPLTALPSETQAPATALAAEPEPHSAETPQPVGAA